MLSQQTTPKKRALASKGAATRTPKKRISRFIADPCKRSLTSLPSEVTKLVLLNINSKFLFRLKFVCKQWNGIIKELLDIKALPVSTSAVEHIFDEFNYYSNQSEEYHSCTIYRSEYKLKNLMNNSVISNLLCAKGELEELTSDAIPERLEESAGDVSYLQDPNEDRDFSLDADEVKTTAWRAIKCLYGLDQPVEELKRHGHGSPFIKSIVSKYKCYDFESHGIKSEVCYIALYPDRQTFAVLMFPLTNIW